MSSIRVARVNGLIQEVICEVIPQLKDPRIGFVTITRVRVTPDLKQARVFVTVMGDEMSRKLTLEVLERASGFIRSEIGKKIRLRFTPQLCFEFDSSIEEGTKTLELIRKLRIEDEG